MANEAVIIELLGNGGDPVRYTCGDGASITKGTILWFDDPKTVSGASIAIGAKAIAGIAAMDKVAGDGSTSISVYTNGIFDLTSVVSPTVTAGDLLTVSGQNLVVKVAAAATTGIVLGTALETASASEVIAVRVKL